MKKVYLLLSIVSVALLTACGASGGLFSTTFEEKVNGDLAFNIPSEFKKVDMEKEDDDSGETNLHFSDFYYSYENKASNGKFDDLCSLSYFYDTSRADETLEGYANIFKDQEEEYENKTINGIEWRIGTKVISEKMTDYTYYAKHDGVFYAIEYSSGGKGDHCEKALDIITNSFKFTK